MSYHPNNNMPPCGRPPQHPLTFGELNYTAEQINALLGMIPFKADRAEVPEMEKLSDVNYLGHITDPSLLTHQQQPSWALVGSLKAARPYFYYVEGFVPQGYTVGWNDVSSVLGTYDLTADKVSIYDFHLLTEYNVSRNHVHSTRVFSKDWGVTTKYYTEFADYIPGQQYAACSKVNMPGYKEHSFMANKATKEAPFTVVEETNEFTFTEAVSLVPKEYRFAGMRVTFINSMTRLAETWYFNGGTWENVGNWQKINFGVGENQLTAEELFKEKFEMPKLIADMAIADEHGNRIPDTYVKRQAVANYIKSVYQELFIANPPLIMEGYITPEMLSEAVKDMLAASGATITNLPDEEDLTNIHGVLKLANKQYNAGAYSGLGRVYLRKNLVGGVNVLTQGMLNKPNTIYIIQYDYDLQGSEITIPEGCTLDFQGGSFSNGTIKGNDTIIKSSPYKIFDTELNITGTWIIDCFYPNWVGVKGDNTDETEIIQRAIDIANFTKCGKLKFLNGVYKITSLNLTSLIGLTIEGANHGFSAIVGCPSGNTKFYVYGKDSVGFDLSNAKSVTIKDIEFYSQEANEENYPSTFILMGRSLKENGEHNHTNSNKLINLEFYGRCKYFGLLINNAEINDFYNLEFSGYFGKACIGLISTNNYVASPFVSLIKTGVSTTCNSFHKCNLLNYMVPDVSDQNENRIISCVYSNSGHFNTAFRDSYIRTTSTSDTVCMRGFVLDSGEQGPGNVIEGGLEISNIRQEGYGNVGEFFYACGYYQIMNIFISNCFTITNKEHLAVITFKPKCRNINISGIHPLSGSNKNFQFNTIEASKIDVIRDGELLFDGEYIAYSILRSVNKFSDNILSHLVYNSVAIDAINVKIGSVVNIGDDKVSLNRSFVLPSIGDLNGSIGVKGLSNTSYDLKFNNKFGEKSIAYRWFGNPDSVTDFNWLKSDSAGTTFLDISGSEAKAMWWDGSKWVDNEGYPSNYKKKGATEERPIIETYYFKGFQYFDTTLNKPIWWTGTAWVDATGATV